MYLIQKVSHLLQKHADKPTNARQKKVVEKVIENVADIATSKRVRKVPVRFKAR